MSTANDRQLPTLLFILRLGIFVVMFFWTLDKFVNPDHSAMVFANFYGIEDAGETLLAVVASLQMLVVLAFMAGALKTYSYGLILLMHAVSTLSSWRQYLEPFDHLLFLAAWPMLAACITVFVLRNHDTLLSVDAAMARR